MDLLDKLRAVTARCERLADGAAMPGLTVIDRVLGPCEVVVQGRPTLMFGSNNYLGLTLHPEVVEAGRQALLDYGAGTTGSRTANGTLAQHEDLERQFADWFGKRHAIIFSTGYQANLSLIGGLCGPDDIILIDGDSHASIYDATRQTAAQVIGFRHNSAESLRKKLERLPGQARNVLVVVEGLYSIRGDVAPLREIVDVCRRHGAYILVDEAQDTAPDQWTIVRALTEEFFSGDGPSKARPRSIGTSKTAKAFGVRYAGRNMASSSQTSQPG